MKKIIFLSPLIIIIIIAALGTNKLQAQQVSARELAKALKECESDLDASKLQIKSLHGALEATDEIILKRKIVADSLFTNLKSQLFFQDSIAILMKMNADTLQLMVRDYSNKLDEVNELYIKELRKQSRPWFLTGNGLKGLFYGVFIGGALGVTFAVLH